MEPAKRIVVNTTAQDAKAVINTCLSLYTVRIVLQALGQDDYGIFNLIAGVIAMIGFITNAMVVTTQRYLSYYQGLGNANKMRRTFSNSVLLHLAGGIVVSLVLLVLMDYLCMDYLNIADDRRQTAKFVYLMSVGMLLVTILSAPFKALFIAHENIIYISVVEVIDAVLKLILALALLGLEFDKLKMYASIMMIICLVQFFAFMGYSVLCFQECRPSKFISDYSKECLKKFTSFATWTTFGMGATVCRQQGLAILINKFFNTIFNTSYGIATQIFGSLSFIVSSIVNAMSPQFIQAESRGDRRLMFHLAEQETKFIVVITSILFIPLIYEMPSILAAWLGDVPPYAVFFCRCIFIIFLIDQLTYGLHTAVQAIGYIRNYTLLMYTPKLLSLLLFWALLHMRHSLESVMYCYIAVEALGAFIRLPYMRHATGMNIKQFLSNALLPILPLTATVLVTTPILMHFWDNPYRFFLSIPISSILGCIVAWFTACTTSERKLIVGFIRKKSA